MKHMMDVITFKTSPQEEYVLTRDKEVNGWSIFVEAQMKQDTGDFHGKK